MNYILVIISAYLLGSIPWAYIISKWAKGIDIRDHGSGNVGFTNALRTIGIGPAIFVLIGDVSKGVAAVLIAKYFGGNAMIEVIAALAVLTGHNYPVFLNFKGGKGAATGFGILLALAPGVSVAALVIWGGFVMVSRYVSLGTIAAAVSVPIFAVIFHEEMPFIIFTVVGAAFVIYKHHSNIKRLIQGTENKIGQKSGS